jgi:hypothetical protein
MSWRATAYVSALIENLTAREKLLLFVLSDYYNDDKQVAWPSMGVLAKKALVSERHAQRLLASLEEKGFIKRTIRHGLQTTLYDICALSSGQNGTLSNGHGVRLEKEVKRTFNDGQTDILPISTGHSCVTQTVEQYEQLNLSPPSSEGMAVSKPSKPKTTDLRFKPFIDLIYKAHKHFVQVDPILGSRPGKYVKELLASQPKLTAEEFRVWLENYHNSENHNPADSPAYYIPKLKNYELGPLNTYGRPKREAVNARTM